MSILDENMTLEELQESLIELEDQLQSVMSLILLTKAIIQDIEIEKIKMAEAEKALKERT